MSRFESDEEESPPTRLVRSKPKAPPAKVTGDVVLGDNVLGNDVVANNVTGSNEATRKAGFEPQGQMGGGNPGPLTTPPPVTEEEKTVVFRPQAGSFVPPQASGLPVVGWLVVIAGPGIGRALEFSYGLNKIGRDSDQNICVDFGDAKISRRHHAAVEFDPRDRKFYLSKGENLLYLNGERVGTGTERELSTGDQLTIGDTTLQFVAFCGPGFNW